MLIAKNLKCGWPWMALTVITVFLIFLPVLNLFFAEGFKWMGTATIVGVNQGGWTNYNARIKEIVDGYPLIGNPYFLEHNQEIPPAFFVADWLAAVPTLIGASLGWSTIINLLFWSLIFVFLAYKILRELGVTQAVSVVGAELSYFQVFSLMWTPVSMQIIFPFYLFFLFSFLFWAKNHADRKSQVLLVLAATSTFYIYTYLWQITITTLMMGTVFWFVTKQKEKAVGMLKVIGCTIIFSAPLFVLTYLQLTHPDYWDSMQRIGFVPTHMPTAEVFYSGRWVILAVLLWFFGFWWSGELRKDRAYKLSLAFFIISGLSMVAVSASNIITGKELELAQHIVRFILAWAPLAFVAFLYSFKNNWAHFRLFSLHKKIVLFILCLVFFFGLASYYKEYLDYFVQRQLILQRINDEQRPNSALNWLERREEKPVVVWVDDSNSKINGYIPIVTKHYVLYSFGGVLHLVSSKEVEERYLVSNYFNNLSLDDIKRDFKLYAGTGNAVHPAKVHNRKVVLCKFFRFNLFGVACGEKTDSFTLKGEKYFSDLYDKYTKEIVPNIDYYLKKYYVSYYVKDRGINNGDQPEKLGMKQVYFDNNFIIYKFK